MQLCRYSSNKLWNLSIFPGTCVALYRGKGGRMWTGLLLTILIQVYPGEVLINGPDGRISVVLDDQGPFIIDQGQLTIGAILASIDLRLEILEERYSEDTYAKIDHIRIIKEIRFLHSLLPAQFYISLDPELYYNDPLIQPSNPMSTFDFAVLIEDLDEEPFSDNKLSLIRIAASSHFFLVEQVENILEYFVFEDDRIEAVRILYPQILDDENSYRLFDKFVFSNSKEELTIILH